MLPRVEEFLRKQWGAVAVGLLGLQMAVLVALQRPLICRCGEINLWEGDIHKSSTQVMDWYTPSHIIHGMLFYAVGWALSRKWEFFRPWQVRALLVLVIEIAWEIFENTPMVIERYRTQTASEAYVGDTILNSFSDSLFMMLGFWMVLKMPARYVFTIALIFEAVALYQVRDNLLLQVLTFLWPIESVVEWQSHV